MLRNLFKDSAYYGVATILSRGISFLLLPLYTHILSPSTFGSLDLLLVFSNLITLTVALEVSQAVQRFFPESDDRLVRRRLFSTGLWFSITSYFVFALFGWASSGWLATLVMGEKGLEYPFCIGILYIFINGVYVFLLNQFRCELRSRDYSLISFIASLVTTSMSLVLTLFARQGLLGLIVSMALGSSVGLVMGFWYLRESFSVHVDFDILKRLLRFSFPLVPSGLAIFANTYIDRFFINSYLSIAEVGIYGFAMRIASLATLFMIAFQNSFTPLIYVNHRRPDAPAQIARIFRIFIVGSVIILLLLSIFSDFLVSFLAPTAYSPSKHIITGLSLGLLLAQMYIFAPGPALESKTNVFMSVNIASALINVALNILLIPPFGLGGAVAATIVSLFIGFCILMCISQAMYPVPHDWSKIIICCLSGLFLSIFFVCNNYSFFVEFFMLAAIVVAWWRIGIFGLRFRLD
jgi:O-antigen/teichoic acid export membrane protein